MKNNDALDALDRLENDALSSRDGYGDTRKDAEMIRNFINTRPQPSGDAVMALDKVLKHYNNEIQYLESIKRTEFGDDILYIYKKFIGKLEPVNAALTQPKADVDWDGLYKIVRKQKLHDVEQWLYMNDPRKAGDHLAAQGYIGVPEGYAIVPIEPTDAMCIAGCKAVYGGEVSIMDANDKAIEYKAMLKAAPKKEV